MQLRQLTMQQAKIYSIPEDGWVHFSPFVKNDEGNEAVHPYPSDHNEEGCVYAAYKLHINLSLEAIPYPQAALIAHNLKKYLMDKIKEGVIPTFKHLNGLQYHFKNADGIEMAYENWSDNETLVSSLVPQPESDVSNCKFINFAQFTISLFDDTSPEYVNAVQSLIIDINRIIAFCGYPIVINNSDLSQSCDSHVYGHISFRKDYFLEGRVHNYVPTSDYYHDPNQTVLKEDDSTVARLAEQNRELFLTTLRHTVWPTYEEINQKEAKENELFLQSKFLPSFKRAHYTPLQLELMNELQQFERKQVFLSGSDKVVVSLLRSYLTKEAKEESEKKREEKDDPRYTVLPGEKLQKILLNEKYFPIIPSSMVALIKDYQAMKGLRAALDSELDTYIVSRAKPTKTDKMFGKLKTMTQDVKTQAANSLREYLNGVIVSFEKPIIDALLEGELGKIIKQDKYQAFLPDNVKTAMVEQKQGKTRKV